MQGVVRPVAAFGMPGSWEWVLIALIGVVVFGRRLPEVARNLGRTVTEFKRGLHDIGNDRPPSKRDIESADRADGQLMSTSTPSTEDSNRNTTSGANTS